MVAGLMMVMLGCGKRDAPMKPGGPPTPATKPAGKTVENSLGGEISGTISIRGEAQKSWEAKTLAIAIGCLGKGPKGELEAPSVGFKLGDTTSGTSTTWSPRDSTLAWDEKTGGTHKHINRPPGRYLVYLRGRTVPADGGSGLIEYEGYFDWKWVELKDTKSSLTVNLTIDPSNQGSLEVRVPAAAKATKITYLPLDADDSLPLADADRYMDVTSSAKLEDGKATIRWLREGKYRLSSNKAKADIEVKRGTTTKIELK